MTIASMNGAPRQSSLRGTGRTKNIQPQLRPIPGGRQQPKRPVVRPKVRKAEIPAAAPKLSRTQAATQLRAGRKAGKTVRTRPKWAARLAALAGFSLAFAAVLVGWLYRDTRDLQAESGLGYALGIISAGCMLILLIYPVRKRIKLLKFIGPVRNWFRIHMMLGVLAPLAALYHCNFQLGSLNSQIALYSALIVAGSGLIGRFLYAKIHSGLYGRRANLKQIRENVRLSSPSGGAAMRFLPELMSRMNRFDMEVLETGRGVLASSWLLMRLTVKTRLEYRSLMRFARSQLAAEARQSSLIADHQQRLLTSVRSFVANHMLQVRRLAKIQAYDQLFALWHLVHLPFFVALVLTVIVHVFAVHLY